MSSSVAQAVPAAGPRATGDRRSAPAAALAALAESGIIFLLVRQLLVENARVHQGPFATYPLFVALFVGGTAWATVRRRRRSTVVVIAILAVTLAALQAVVWGSTDPAGVLFACILGLLAAMRVLGLAHRDWQDPIGQSFAIGTAALLVEVAMGSSLDTTWHRLLLVVIPQFFLASLASRAVSVRLVTRPAGSERHEDPGSARRVRGAIVGIAALAAVMGAVALLGGKGGALEQIGRLLYLILSAVLIAMAFVLARIILGPVAWLFARLHINLDALQRAAQRFRLSSSPASSAQSSSSGWIRVLGFMVMAGVFVLLLTALRRRWHRMLMPNLHVPDHPEPPALHLAGGRSLRRSTSRIRRWEPPADAVRRWYAEALMALERRGLAKPSSGTPGEFAPQVARAFPECAHGFRALTRAYEDVRYGSVALDRPALERLAEQHRWAMEVFRRGERKDRADDHREA
jgi:hypothetical protein